MLPSPPSLSKIGSLIARTGRSFQLQLSVCKCSALKTHPVTIFYRYAVLLSSAFSRLCLYPRRAHRRVFDSLARHILVIPSAAAELWSYYFTVAFQALAWRLRARVPLSFPPSPVSAL